MGWAMHSVKTQNYMALVTPNAGIPSLLESSYFLSMKEQKQGTQKAMD